MRLQKIFFILALVLATLVAGQMLKTVYNAASQLRNGATGLSAMSNLRLILAAAEMASRERGPSNGFLGDELPHDPKKLSLLTAARQRTDAAFAEIIEAAQKEDSKRSGLQAVLLNAQKQLQLGRSSIDSIAATPKGQRTPEQIRAAIDQMFMVIDDLAPIALQLTNVAQSAYPNQTNFLLAARAAAELREYAGRLGSHFTVALTKRERIEMVEFTAIEQLIGRIVQLRSELLERVEAIHGVVAVEQATNAMQSRYFESALPYVNAQLAFGLRSADFSMDAAGFAQRYVPDMDSIIDLRNVLTDQALRNAETEQTMSRNSAYLIIIWAIASLVLLVTIFLILEFRVSRPLRRAIQLILDVADGRNDVAIPTLKYQDEMKEVMGAIAILRDNGLARVALEGERQELLDKLKEQAANDFLTGLPNRRGFFDLVEPLFWSLNRQGHPISVAMFDVDRFKQVNDTYGHAAGDEVLQTIAKLSKAHLRSGDVVSRFGGEEFLLFMPYCNVEAALTRADQLRRTIETTTMELAKGRGFNVTASFGVAQWREENKSIQDLIDHCDEKLYLAKASGRNRVMH